MKFLADENFPRPAVRALREHAYEVAWATEDSPGSADEEVLARCTSEKLTLLTLDKGFGELVFLAAIGAFILAGVFTIEAPVLSLGRHLEMRVFFVPLVDVALRDLRAAEGVIAMRVQSANPVGVDGQVTARELRGGGARKTGDQNGVGAESLDGAPDLPGQVGGFARSQSRGAEDAEFPRFFGPRLRDVMDSVYLEGGLVSLHDRPLLRP
jgi:hypothetical protein